MPVSVSIIVVNYNSWQVLSRLLESLLQQQLDSAVIDQLSIVIVDNNSSLPKPDLTEINEALTQQNIITKWVDSDRNIGFAGGCNLGARKAHTDLLLFCNPDIEIPESGLNTLVLEHHNQPVGILAPTQVDIKSETQSIQGRFPTTARYIPLLGSFFKQAHQNKTHQSIQYSDWVSGSVVLIKKRDFERLNGWDEDYFMFMEDVDLCYRAAQIGLKTGVTHLTTWMHLHGASSRQMEDRIRSKSAALAAKHIYVKKHFRGWRKALTHTLIFLKYAPELLLAWLLSWPIPEKVLISRRHILHNYMKQIKDGFKKTN